MSGKVAPFVESLDQNEYARILKIVEKQNEEDEKHELSYSTDIMDKSLNTITTEISNILVNFVNDYILMKEKVHDTLKDSRYIIPFSDDWGTKEDPQCWGVYSHYADIAMETLLAATNETLEKKTKLKLSPTYTYTRLYKNGDQLKKHKDRFSCEISGTADDLSLDLSGASIAKFYELYAKGAIVNVSGASTANIRVSELLKGDISGASIINYKGDAIVKEMKASGISSIRYRN